MQKSIQIFNSLKSIDNKFGSEEFRIKLFGAAKAKKFGAYQKAIREPLTDDDNKNKSTVDYMKIKISTNYDTGEIIINNIRFLSVDSDDGLVRLTIEAEKGIIESKRGNILTIDENDPIAISTVLEKK